MVEPVEGKTLVYSAAPKVEAILEVTEWPRVYRARNEVQEHSFKRMLDHGALNTNYGRKKIVTADRHQQRAREKLEQALATAQKRVDKKAEAIKATQNQVAVSESKGHGKRLAQRQAALAVLATELKDAQYKQAQLAEQVQAVGPSGQRADRDFRWCPSTPVMELIPTWKQVLDCAQLIQECCRDAVGEQFVGRPDMISQACRHPVVHGAALAWR